MLKNSLILVALVTLSGCGGLAGGSGTSGGNASRYLVVVDRELDIYTQRFFAPGDGWRPVTARVAGSAARGATRTHEITVSTAGGSYGVLGACDQDCSDVDIAIIDRSGNVVAADVAADDYPVVRWTAAYAGTYTAQVRMVQCRTSICYYGLQLFQR